MLTMHSRWNGSRRSGHWLTERWPIAAALLLVGMAALFAAPAQAATVTLVSNFGSVGNNAHVVGDLNASVTRIQAQKFTTGANTSGYTLESLKFKVDVYDGANITSRVSIYSVGSDGKPGSGLYSLTGTITSTGNKTFRAPANATLEASTSYFVYFEDTDSSTPRHHYSVNRVSSGSTLDTGSQSGWTMGARHQKQNAGNWTTHSNQKLAIQLKGTVNVTPQNVEMVSNLGEASTDTAFLTQDWAQTFTAGSSPNGYTLTSVTIDFNAIVSGSPAVSVWSTDSNGRPNSKLADLTNPASITTGANTFTAPAGTTLSMGERYAVAIGQWSGAELKATQRNSEDSGAQSGWSIHDESWAKPSHVPWENAGNHLFSLRIRVNGAINPQERPTYVSNLEQTENNFNSEETSAQAFTTGSFAGGYALESVDVKFDTIPASISIAAAIYSEDADGFPDTQVHSLTSPSTLAGSDVVRTFTAPAGAVLAPSTTYFLVMNPSGFITYARTNSSNEDTAETGWSIANQHRRQNDGSTTWSTASSKSLLIRVNGPTSADATLSGLVLEDARDDSAVELDPTFVSTELSYTAFVSNSVDEITIKPSVNHAAAEFDFLDGSDATLTDADTVQDDFQASLAEGENTIKVKVTASDGNATATYTVDVTRVFPVPTTEVALVSNMGKGSVEAELIRVFAQTFTTGTNPNGYTLTSIELDFTVVPTSGSPAVSLWSVDSDGLPSSKLTDLTNPASITTGANIFTAPAETALSRGESYAVLINSWSGARINVTNANREDDGAQPGWSIRNNGWSKDHPIVPWVPGDTDPESIKVRVNGFVTGEVSADATLSDLTVNDGTDDLILTPAFVPGTYLYAVDVGAAVDEVTLTATVNDDGAAVSGVTLGGAAITDSDFTDGITVPSLVVGDNDIVVTVTAEDTSTALTYTVTVTRAEADTTVPSDWSLTPAGLSAGDQFRLIFVSSTSRNGSSSDISDYDSHVQAAAAGGHAAIQAYSSQFKAVGCTSSTDALSHTGTSYTATDKGVLIRWLGGAKVADDYEDFYDGGWDSTAPRNQAGGSITTNTGLNAVLSGCNDDGTAHSTSALGNSSVAFANPSGNSGLFQGLTSPNNSRKVFGLSPVFEVAAAEEVDPLLWSATMTVGSSGDTVGFSDGFTGSFNAIGSLSPSQFSVDGEIITMNSLIIFDDHGDIGLSLEFTHSILGNSDYTLELDDESFILSGTGGFGFFDADASSTFADGDTVAVKLFEGSGGGALSDDATLTSLDFYVISGENEELVTLTPAFHKDTIEYEAGVDYQFIFAAIFDIVRGDSGASVLVTDEFNEYDLQKDDDFTNELDLAIGENTIMVKVTAADGTTVTYELIVTRAAPPPPEDHCGTGDIWCATLTVASLSGGEFGYSGAQATAQGTLSHVAFYHGKPFYLVERLSITTTSGLRIDFHPLGETVFNTDSYSLVIDGTEFAFSDATFSDGHFEWADSGLSWTSADTVEVRLVAAPPTEVPSDWSLIPADLNTGDQFRLIFLSSTSRTGSDTEITPYNTFVQTLAAAGHTDIQAYRDGFKVVGCTAAVDAVGNTGTFGVGVPIYWLNGAKVADDYADFYDGDWDEEDVNKNELGANGPDTSNSNNYPITGCDHDGTEASTSSVSESLGADGGDVRVGRPDSSDTDHGPLSSTSTTSDTSNHPMYGLSAVFQVAAAPPTEVPSDWSLIPAALTTGDTFRLIFLSSTKRKGSATDIATYNTFVQDRVAVGHPDIQDYRDGFKVVGCTVDTDAVANTSTVGVGVPIYWLNGNKVADDYADFYDEDWDEEAVNKNELGNDGPDTSNSGNYPITGCDHDGTDGSSPSGDDSNRLGGADGGFVTIGRPNSSTSGDGPLSSTSTTSDNSNRPMYGLSEVFKVVAAPPTEVPADWSLIPAALTTGDTFRLIFLSSTKRNGSATDIATYNTFVQDLAAAGHADIQAYSDGFRVVGCTAAVDAVGNTDTTGVGVPIYWLNGNKVADDYADFYDEDWDEEAVNKNELGANGRNTNNSGNYPITGCDHDGTEAFAPATPPSVALGSSTSVRVGRPNSSDPDNGPISSSSNVGNGTDRPMYGLSEVFKVVAAANATGKPAIMGTAEVGQTLTASKGTIVDTNGTTKADNGDSGYAYTYQWVRVSGGTETTISGATGTTYTQVADDVGNTIKVQASFTDDTDNAEGPLTSDATAAVVEACDALWCATMTVGSSGGATGFSDGTGEFNAMGSLSPSQFRFEGAAITMNSLAYAGSSTNVDLSLEFTHSILGSSDYTLELNDESFILSVTGGSGFFDVEGLPARPNFANSDTVTVKLYEGVRGGSDDATLTSLEFWEASGEDTELVTLTPAFDAGTTEYTAAVDYRFLHASIQNIVRGHNGALVVVTDEFGSHDLGSVEDSAEGLELAVGENTITVEVTAEDRNTTVTYTLVVTRTAPPPPPAHCETGDIWCATLTVASLPDSQIGYSGTLGALSHVAFEHDGPFYLVEALYFITVSGVGNSLRIEFHPSGGTVFNTDAYSLFIDGTEFAFSDATFSSGHFEWADTGLLWAPADTVEVRLFERTAPAVRVPTDWSLIPAGLTTGDQFRLIFLSSTRRNGTATDIATYNSFVQTRAAAGHTDIQAYSTWFSVVGCTADTDAIVNTGTTGGGGVPIYWLNGAKVADDYADFYDGDWDEEAVNKNELGENGLDITNSDNYPLTGCDHDGTESLRSNLSFGLGTSDGLLTVGRPNSSGTDRGPLFSDSDVLGTDNHPMYGLSAVFGVGVEGANSDPTFPMSTAVREVAENTEAGQVVGTVLTATDFDMDTLTYSLEGTNLLSFDLDTTTTPGSAQIRTKTGVTYDHEVKSSYSVIIKADDGHGGTPARVTVTITITDVSEAPERPAAPTVMATAGSTTSLDVSWNAPTNTGPNIDNYDLQYREGTSGGFTDGPQDVTGTSAAIPSLDAGTSYQVQVRATNAEGDSDWSLSGSGTTTAEACDGIWCATLMPQAISGSGGGLGCANSSTGDRCTNTAHLTEDEFRHDMTDYQVTAVQVRNNNGQLQLWISPDLTTATQSLVLHVGSESFAFEDADTKQANNRRWNSSGLSWSVGDTIELKLTEGAGPPTEVPADWSLIPAALSSGDTFRLIFLSSTRRNGSATDIATYNTFVQDRAAAGHADIQAYSDGFRVVGCTATVDARDNTGTTYTSSNKGVPIYWLSGNKVADDYEDFYDENWDDEANDKNELGNNGPDTTNPDNYPLTGCDHDGTEAFAGINPLSRSLGSTTGIVRVGRPNSSDTDDGPISNSSTGATFADNRPMYGLSAVFKVAAAANSDPTFPMSTAARSVLENTAAGQNVGAVLTASDSDGDTLTYTLEGTDAASFELDTTTTPGSAQIQTKSGVTYDHEAKSSYTVVVKADDGGGGTAASVTVTITITDVSEAPERPAAPTVMATAGSTTSLSVSWTAPATTGPDIDDYDLRYREGTSGSWSNGPQNVTATLASIGSLDAGTSYQVQVRATNDEGNSNWSLSGSGSTTAEATPTVSISADKTSAVFKEDEITYTLTRSGSTTAAMDVTVTLTQTKDFLATTELSKTVTISAGQTTETFTVLASSFQHFAAGAQVGGGTLTATVQDGTDYDLGTPSSVDVAIVIGVMVRLEAVPLVWEPTASFTFKVIARTGAGAPYPSVATGSISVFSEDISAIKNTDFGFVSASLNVHPGNFMADGAMWEAETTYTVSIENDALDEDDETFNLVIERPQASLAYSLVDASGNSCGSKCTVMKTITDDDTAGVTISKSSLTVTEQDSSGDTYTVVLDSQPTANVTISIGGQSGTDVTAAPTPMTFTTGNWATAQTVTVTGDDDADLTNDMVSLTHNAASSDSDYDGITITGLTVTVADNDTARVTGLMIEPGNAQLVVGWSEVANASGYHVQWKSGGQSYNNNSRRDFISSGSTTSHTISSLSNGTEYTVRVRATRTGANNGAYSAEVLETPVMPTAAGVTISESALTLTEQDTTGDSYTVVLDRQPTASVTVTVGGLGSSDLTANPSSLTFTTGNWATAQTVTVTAGNDADTTNDTVSLTHNAASSDSAYHGITIAGLAVTVADNDTAQVTGLMITPGNAQLVVGWSEVANATGYEVQWKSGGQSYNTSGQQATITSGLTRSHTISSLTNGTEYTVRVRATRTGANSGAYSAEVLETPVMPVVCDVLWCATLTVGQHPTFGTLTGFDALYGALTPNEFTRNGSPITVNALYHTGNSDTLSMEYTGDLSGSGYTLELGSRSFDLPDPDGDGFFDVDTSRGWRVGDTVEVTLSENANVMASDIATLESLTVSYLIDVVRTNNAPITPAFSPETTSYTAGVPSGVTQALLSATATEAGAELVVTLPDGSTQHDTGDADEVVGNVSPGLNTFTVTVTAPDGITEKVYTVIVDRGGGLSGRIENLPSSHDGSTAFSVTLKFNTDISEDSIDNLDRAVEITNGTKSDLAAVGNSKRNFTMTITPSSGDPVRILVRQTLVCSSSGHPICTDVGDALGQDIKRWVGKEDDARLSALWLTTKDGIWIGGIRSDTYSYDGRHFQSELTMQAAPYAKGATVVVTGPAGTFTAGNRWDGGATAKLDVPEGATTWRVTVTSADGNETKTYRVTVRRGDGGGGGGPAADVRLKTLTVTPVDGTLLSFTPGFHLGTEATTFRIRVSSGTTAVTVSVEKNASDPDVRLMRTETDPLDSIDEDPDLAGVQFDLEMDRFDLKFGRQNRYKSIWVIGPNARVEGHTAFDRRVYQLWITKAAASMATAAEPLMAAFENPPLSHDGSSVFTLRMAFSEDVEITPEDMRDHALTVFGATVTGAEQVEGLKTLWDLTLQPSGNGPVSILTPLNRACTEVGALCTADGGTLTVAPALQIAGPPPPQGSAPDTPDRPVGTAVFVGGVDLEWNDVPGADSYDVQLFRNGQWMDLPGDGVEIAFYGAGAIISELDPGSTHWFQVRARNAHSSSDWSDFRQVGSTNQSSLGKQARPDNVTASEAPVINGTAQVGESLTADTTGIEDGNGLDRVQFRFQWVSNDGSADADITGATDSSYTLVAADEGKTVKVRVSFTDRGGYAESLTSAATDAVTAALIPLTVSLENNPATHNGTDAFTFEIRFSEEFALSFRNLKFDAFTVTGGTVKKAQRVEKPSNILWRITVQPHANGNVTIVLPVTNDCDDQGAICTGDGRKLSNRLEFTVAGPDG